MGRQLLALAAEHMETNHSFSSSVPEYSDDTFTSFSEKEEEETYKKYDDSFESYYSEEESGSLAVSDLSESIRRSLSRNEEQGSEFLNLPAIGEHLTGKWIRLLKNKKDNTEVDKTAVEPEGETGVSGVSEEGQGAQMSFCAVKINLLHCCSASSAPLKRNKWNDQWHGCTSEEKLMCDLSCIVPDQLVNRLHLKNIKETVKQIAEAEIHQPSRCLPCREKKAELAKSAFLKRKKALMEEVLLREKLEEHMYAKDSLTLIGEIHRSLPKLSEDPTAIWQKLNKSPATPESGLVEHKC